MRVHRAAHSASISDRRVWPNIWSNDENYRRKVGRRSCSITLMGSMRWICSSCRQSRFACSMDCRSWGTADDKFYGLASQLIQLRSGSQIRSRKHAAGKQDPRYLIRDRDGAYGEVFVQKLRSMGIRDRPTSPRSHVGRQERCLRTSLGPITSATRRSVD